MSIYKDCDIRGIYGRELTAEDTYKIGRALATLSPGKILVGGDVRLSTPELKERLICGLVEGGVKVEDMLMAVGKLKDGTAFLFDPSWSRLEEKLKVPGPGWERFPKRMEVNVTITGDKGMLSCDCFGPNVYHNGAPNDRYTVQYTYFDEWVGLIDEFVDCIREHKTPLINLRWHKETIQAMLGCYESIQTGKIVQV